MTLEPATEPFATTAFHAEYRRLALLAAKGDATAEKELIAIEARIADAERAERRREAADAEANRLAIQAQEQAAAAAKIAAEKHLAKARKTQIAAYGRVQQLTGELAMAVKAALEAGGETRAAALRLGYVPGRLPVDEITGYIAWKLGRDDGAGCDFPYTLTLLRSPLVPE
jgi:hypothetical protein